MKRILAILLCTLLTFTSTVFTCFADTANTEERYYSIPVEYSDHIGIIESLKVMIKGDHVYADAEMLAKALGYQVRISDEVVMIVNKDNDKLPQGFTKFYFNNTKVEHTIFVKALDTYKAPFASVKNDKGYWIPLEYSLLLLNSNCMIANNTLLIDNSEKKIADYYRDIQSNKNKYFFDFEKDFGYSGKDINRIGRYSHLVNQFNGLIDFEGTAWGSMFQSFILESSSYDKKYGENLALLLCGESQGELDAVKAKNDLYLNLLSEDGGLGSFLSQRSVYLDLETKAAYNTCEKILKEVRNGNTSASTYSKSYQILQKTLDKRTWFSKTGGNIMELQKKLSDVTSVLQVGSKVLEVVGYGSEFAKHDRFSLSSLKYFLDHSAETVEISKAMKTSMKQYSESLEKQVAEYTTKRFFEENVNDWVVDGLSIKKALGTQANAILFAWDISSNVIPFISNGLSSADKFEQALYAMVFQGNTEHNYIASRNALFNRPEDITAERLYNLSQYCYIYLKSCYVTRNAALGSLEGKSGAVKKKIKPLLDYQNGINDEISQIMVALKSANRTNKGNVYGFLPENNEEYLKDFDDRKLAEFCRGMTPLEENSPYVGEWILDTEKTNEMNEYSLFDAFGSALTEYGNGMELKEDGTFTYYMGAGNGGQGTWKMNDKAIKYSITQYESNRKVNGQLITESDWLVMKDYFDDGEGYDMYWKRDGGQ